MKKSPSKLRRMWNAICGRNPATNADGTITTKFGDRIVPLRYSFDRNGALHSNVPAVISQPRHWELVKAMTPPLDSLPNDKVIVNYVKGAFFLKSDLDKNGVENATPICRFDPKLEAKIVKMAFQMAAAIKLGDLQKKQHKKNLGKKPE